jgi:hypothetical protein
LCANSVVGSIHFMSRKDRAKLSVIHGLQNIHSEFLILKFVHN